MCLLADSALPCGGFVASGGLESASQHGLVDGRLTSGPGSLLAFIDASLRGYAAQGLRFVRAAWEAMQNVDDADAAANRLVKLDAWCDQMLAASAVARQASIAQGAGLLTVASKALFDAIRHQPHRMALDAFRAATRRYSFADNGALRTPGHQPPVLGALLAALGLSLERSLRLALFLQARSSVSAAVRLNLVGPFGGQQLLLHLEPTVVLLYEREMALGSLSSDASVSEALGPSLPHTSSPLVEIASACHSQLYSRLFHS